MARIPDPKKEYVLCRGCKEDFLIKENELDYEGYCSLCVAAHERTVQQEQPHGQ
jgi:hypothetical protein